MTRVNKWIGYWAIAGVAGPMLWFVLIVVMRLYRLEAVIARVWPSSAWLFMTDGIEGTPLAFAYIALAVLANVILYAVVGTIIFWIARAFANERWGRHRTDRNGRP